LVPDTTTTLVALMSMLSLCSLTVASGWKFIPSRSVISTGSPVTLESGIMLVIIGAGFFTVKPFARVPDCPPGLVTTTFHEPTAALDGNAKVQIILLVDANTPDAVIFWLPNRVRLTVAPVWKLVPPRLVILTVVPLIPVFGVMLVTVIAGGAVVAVVAVVVVAVVVVVFVIVNAFPSVAACPSGLVTVTFHVPAIAMDGIENRQVMFDADWAVTLVPKMVEGDVTLVSLTLAPGRKFVPDMLLIVTTVPASPVFGMMLLTVGAG